MSAIMDEKRSSLPEPSTASTSRPQRSPSTFSDRIWRAGATAGILFICYLLFAPQTGCTRTADQIHLPLRPQSEKVRLEAHIMSKCPDARDCLQKLVLPVMANVSDKVDFKLSYIGVVTNHDDEVACMHGQTECLGNIAELCAADVYPDPRQYLGFTNCLSQRYKDIPHEDLLKDCSLEYGIDFSKLNDCMSKDDGAYAMGMLRDSVTRSEKAGVRYSCTVRLEEEVRCIRDDGNWKDCKGGSKPEDLIKQIEELYEQNSANALLESIYSEDNLDVLRIG